MKTAKKIVAFFKRWSDVLIFLPVCYAAFLFNDYWVRLLDPTAATVNPEYLGILNWNLVVLSTVTSVAYFIYNLFFHDYFGEGWEEKVDPNKAMVVHLILWLTTLSFVAYILTRGLGIV